MNKEKYLSQIVKFKKVGSGLSISQLETIGENKDKIRRICSTFNEKDREFTKYGIDRMRYVLIYGPHGTGKTSITETITSLTVNKYISVNFHILMFGDIIDNIWKLMEEIRFSDIPVLFEGVNFTKEYKDKLFVVMDVLKVYNNIRLLIFESSEYDDIIVNPKYRELFDVVIRTTYPDNDERQRLIERFLNPIPRKDIDIDKFVEDTKGLSGKTIKLIIENAMKYSILRKSNIEIDDKDIESALSNFKDVIKY